MKDILSLPPHDHDQTALKVRFSCLHSIFFEPPLSS
jgi:hypothetical protein